MSILYELYYIIWHYIIWYSYSMSIWVLHIHTYIHIYVCAVAHVRAAGFCTVGAVLFNVMCNGFRAATLSLRSHYQLVSHDTQPCRQYVCWLEVTSPMACAAYSYQAQCGCRALPRGRCATLQRQFQLTMHLQISPRQPCSTPMWSWHGMLMMTHARRHCARRWQRTASEMMTSRSDSCAQAFQAPSTIQSFCCWSLCTVWRRDAGPCHN